MKIILKMSKLIYTDIAKSIGTTFYSSNALFSIENMSSMHDFI